MSQLAVILDVALPELVEALWRETVGDPCPCGCGGKKIFPERPEARTLAIELPCEKCGLRRVYKRWRKGNHRKRCGTCGKSGERAEYTKATCRDCRRTVRRLSSYFKNLSSFDPSSNPPTYQCNRCGSLERLNATLDEELREIEARELGESVKIRARVKRLALFQDQRHQIWGGKLRDGFSPEEQERGRRKYAENAARGKRYPKKTIAQAIRGWSPRCAQSGCKHDPHPKGCSWAPEGECKRCSCQKYSPTDLPTTRFGLCIVCRMIDMNYGPEEPHFHAVCHRSWETTEEGRDFQSRKVRGKKASLPPAQRGPRVTEENLKKHYSWAIQRYLENKSWKIIAERSGVKDETSVRDAVGRLIERLEPSLLGKRFQPVVKLLLDAARASSS